MGENQLSSRSRTVHTACPLDCPDSCSLDVTVDGERVVAISGSRAAPVTEGLICGKVRHFYRRVYHPERVLYPGVRSGPKGSGQFRRVSWEEALELVSRRLMEAKERFGAESVLPYNYGGSNGVMTNEGADARFFRRLGASRLARTLCAAPTGAAAMAMYGKMPGVAFQDYEHSRLIIVWGCNPPASGLHLVAHIKRAQRAGAKLVVIDPRKTPLTRQADLHLPVRPGTDLPVALALIRQLFVCGGADLAFLERHACGVAELRRAAEAWTLERAAQEAGLEVTQLATLAEWYAHVGPAVIRCGWGQERNRNGGAATMAILALPAVAGKFGVRGGGYTMSNSSAWGLQSEELIGVPAPPTRVVNMNQLGRALLEMRDPPIAALFVYNANPLSTAPDQNRVRQGLRREDLFTVVHEQVQTDTAAYADVLLPATTFLEHVDLIRGYGAYHLHRVEPAIGPVGEARSNVSLFNQLAARLGQVHSDSDRLDSPVRPEPVEGPSTSLRATGTGRLHREKVLGQVAAGRDDERAELDEVLRRIPREHAQALAEGRQPTPAGGGRPVQFVDVRPNTVDGRIQLFPSTLETTSGLYEYQADPASSAAPLSLISPASAETTSSTLGELREEPVPLHIHPDDAQRRGIRDGANVRVFNEWGEVQVGARVTSEVRPGTVSLPKGLWARSTLNGATANALVPDSLTDLGGGACFNDARVEVELLVPPA